MRHVVVPLLILFSAASTGYAGELPVVEGAGIPCSSCDKTGPPGMPDSSPAASSPMPQPVGQGAHNSSYFPVVARGMQQFDAHASKLDGESFRWHAP